MNRARISKNRFAEKSTNFNTLDLSGVNPVLEETVGITHIVDDAPSRVHESEAIDHPESTLDLSRSKGVGQTMASFLSRPVVLTDGIWSTTDLTMTQLFKFDVGPTMLSIPLWADKLKGFMLMRGTAVVRLQLNAQPFQAGRLILGYLPNHRHYAQESSQHLYDLTTTTQIPHVQMDASNSEVVLRIPYISPTPFFNLLDGLYDWGRVFVIVYSPLTTGSSGSLTADYTVWLSFEDVELEAPIVPQSVVRKNQRGIINKYRINKSSKSSLDSEIHDGQGPISSTLSSVSTIASNLAAIPVLAPIAGPSAWFSNLLSGVASAFGWSKPIVDDRITRTQLFKTGYMAVTNEPDQSDSLALIVDNKVCAMPDASIRNVDEMSINFIKSVFAYSTQLSWDTSTPLGFLGSISCNPHNLYHLPISVGYSTTTSVDLGVFTPIGFLAYYHQYWRGGLKFKFKFVKTKFHSGRIAFSFSPSGAVTDNTASSYLHREVVDIRYTDEVEFVVPYVSNMTWNRLSDFNRYNPKLNINVINQLRAPETVSSRIAILMEVCGADDFEVACPIGSNATPVAVVTEQSGDDLGLVTRGIGNSKPNSATYDANALSIGEASTSLLQNLKRYSRVGFAAFDRGVAFKPFTNGGFYVNPLTGVGGTVNTIYGDQISLFSSFYAHSRGGVRWRLLHNSGNGHVHATIDSTSTTSYCESLGLSIKSVGFANGDISVSADNRTGSPVTFMEQTSVANMTSVQVPHYGATLLRLNRIAVAGSNAALQMDQPDFRVVFYSNSATFNSPLNYDLYRSAADDYQLSSFVGIPPLVVVGIH